MTSGFQLWRYFLVLWKKYNLRNFLKSKQQQIVALLREKCLYSVRDRNDWTSETRIRVDRNVHGGGILLYVTGNIPSKLLSIEPIVGSGITLRTPEKRQQRCFQCFQWEPQPRHIICLPKIGTLDIKCLCNKADWKKRKICFLFSNFTNFLLSSLPYQQELIN